MKCDLRVEYIRAFFQEHQIPIGPCLVAWSGGADSTCLLHLILDLYHEEGISTTNIHAAYLDHGWRLEAKDEALFLAQEAKKLGISFHTAVLAPSSLETKGNLEERARLQRYHWLETVCRENELQFIFVGHHRDDQQEGVLKRIFEGASLLSLSGMQLVRKREAESTLCRPLLPFSRQDIEKWLATRQLSYFIDPTNYDTRYTRSKIRHHLIPELSDLFGKNIEKPLAAISEEASQLGYFIRRVLQHSFELTNMAYGSICRVREQKENQDFFCATDPFIIYTLLQSLKKSIPALRLMSREQLYGIRDAFIDRNKKERLYFASSGTVLVSYNVLWAFPYKLEKWEDLSVEEKKTRVSYQENLLNQSIWQDLFETGKVRYFLPYVPGRSYRLGVISDTLKSTKKIPERFSTECPFRILRQYIPSVWDEKSGEILFSPFLETRKKVVESEEFLEISVQIAPV